MIDAFATHAHLVGHLAPIFAALHDDERGTFYVTGKLEAAYASRYGIEATIGTPRDPIILDPAYAKRYGITLGDQPHGDHPTLVGSHHDITQIAQSRPVVYVEHGAGQSYNPTNPGHPSYSGGAGRDRVALFLTLNETTAKRERAAYPDTPVVVIGSPRMEALRAYAQSPPLDFTGNGHPVVAYAPHWNCDLNPETRWAFPEWRAQLSALAKSGVVTMLGHGHPRIYPHLVQWYEHLGVECVRDFEDVCARADLLITDNSSAGPEFAAATGKPVLWLNASGYRKDADHGGRFWSWIGAQVMLDVGKSLPDGVTRALADDPWSRAARRLMVASVYPSLPGTAVGRAVDAIREAGLA